MMSYRRLGWSSPRVIACLVSLGIALFSAATVLAAPQYDYSCDACHRMPPLDSDTGAREPATGATKGNHQSHSGATGATCVKCHGSELTSTGHRDKTIQVEGNINGSPKGGSYTRIFLNQTSVPPNPLGTCSNTNCHFEQPSPAWGRLPNYQLPADCNQCHLMGLDSGSHPKHAAYYGSGTGACVNCHPNHAVEAAPFRHATSAANRGIAVSFKEAPNNGGTYSGNGLNFLPSQGKTSFGECSNVYCHSDGTGSGPNTPAVWGGSLPADCTGCHGGNAGSGRVLATGAHGKHINNADFSAGINLGTNYSCARCHNGTVGAASDLVITGSTSHVDGSRQVAFPDGGDYRDGSCSATACHWAGKTGVAQPAAPAWGGGALDCKGCHGIGSSYGEPNYANAGAGLELANSHGAQHVSGPSSCVNCHAGTTSDGLSIVNGSTAHTDGKLSVSFPADYNPGGAAYDGSLNAKTCANTYCHGSGQAPQWGSTAALSCSSCHAAGSGLAGQHGAHWQGAALATSYNATPGNTTGSAGQYNFACSSCHNGAHAKGPASASNAAEVFFNYTAKGLQGSYRPGGATAMNGTLQWSNGTCSGTYCHSNGNGGKGLGSDGMNWSSPNGTLSCNGCHGGDYSRPDPIDTNLHRAHLDPSANVSLGTGNAMRCAACHAKTMSAASDTTLADKRLHVNKFKDYSGLLAGGSSSYDQAQKRCGNIYCHSNGKLGTPVAQPRNPGRWDAVTSLGCNGCHGSADAPDFASDPMGTPNYVSGPEGSSSANSHKLHLQKMGSASTNVCYACHARTVDKYAERTFRPYSSTHLSDGSTHVAFGKIATSGFQLISSVDKARYQNKTCSNVACHSDGRGGYQDVKWGATSNCAMCHPLNKLSRGHSFHVNTAGAYTRTSYDNYTASWTGGSNTEYNYGCANCHPINNPNHTRGTVLIDLKKGEANVVGTLRSRNGAAITQGGVEAGTAGSGTTRVGNELYCDNVYCHSNGYSTDLVYAPVPGWYSGNFTGDRCAACHGNAPNSTIAGSPSHYNNAWLGGDGTGGHIIGVHANVITNGVNFNGLLTPGTTDPSSHGATPNVTPTTMSCNTCHYSVVTTSANSSSAQCNNCHKGTAPTTANAFIANKSLHVNGSVSVAFRPTRLYSKAQLSATTFQVISSVYMERVNGYKAPTSYDVSKIDLSAGSYAGNGGNCTTVCHMNRPVRWDNFPAATCNSCHTGTPAQP